MGTFSIRAALLKIFQQGTGIAEVQIDSLEGVGDRYIGADATGKIKAMPDPGGGGGTPASPTRSVQFNNAGAFGGASNILYDTDGVLNFIADPAGPDSKVFYYLTPQNYGDEGTGVPSRFAIWVHDNDVNGPGMRHDVVGSWFSYNYNTGGSSIVAGEAAFAFKAETYWLQDGTQLMEFHMPEFNDDTGTGHRLFSIYTHRPTGYSYIQSQVNSWSFRPNWSNAVDFAALSVPADGGNGTATLDLIGLTPPSTDPLDVQGYSKIRLFTNAGAFSSITGSNGALDLASPAGGDMLFHANRGFAPGYMFFNQSDYFGDGNVWFSGNSDGSGKGFHFTSQSGTEYGQISAFGIYSNAQLGAAVLTGSGDRNVMADSLGRLIIKSEVPTNPGVYFSPGQSFDPTFVVFASAIVFPELPAVNNDPITWGILDHATQHNSSFFESAEPNTGSQRLRLNYPLVKNVLNGTVTLDESFAGAGLSLGPTVATSNMDIAAYQQKPVAIKLTGDGAGGWTKSGEFDNNTIWDIAAPSSGTTKFNLVANVYLPSYDQIVCTYSGPNNYGLARLYSGLGAYNAAFVIIDRATGSVVTSNPTTSDEIFIHTTGVQSVQTLLGNWTFANNAWMASVGFNFWVFGAFECYLVAAPISSSSIQVRWQNLGADSYRVARSTSLAGTYTDIFTGTDLQITDGGLTANTLYYYKLFYTVSAVETELTYFKTNTFA